MEWGEVAARVVRRRVAKEGIRRRRMTNVANTALRGSVPDVDGPELSWDPRIISARGTYALANVSITETVQGRSGAVES